jgi:phenylpropionate dioxygenase-like ring-hydroxylating dioxygenase large terminal subunit
LKEAKVATKNQAGKLASPATADSVRQQLIRMARENIEMVKSDQLRLVDDVLQVPAHHYYDEERWRGEIDHVFRRLPLMLALGCELKHPGDYKTLEVCGVPVLLVRDESLEVRAYINSCSHRGAVVVTERSGNKRRFSCPYHAWTFNHDGDLVAILSEHEFGEIDKSCRGLTPLPVGERAGMVWVTLDPESQLDLDTFLCGYDALLEQFDFSSWELFDHRTLKGPNWKIAYDGYLDLYHLPVLHRDTFGTTFPNQAIYDAWGPHQRATSPNPELLPLEQEPEEQWPTPLLLEGVWTIFPHVSIAGFDGGGGRGVMVSQLFPGDAPGESFTVQNYVMEKLPDSEEKRQAATEQFSFLEVVVRDEDYSTGLAQQRALRYREGFEVLFGRNEGGGQHFHRFLDALLECEDRDLAGLFKEA